ncbi:hypothetical protein DCCM_0739 [Desulfocucumis palustris]|uniref:Uncharacterized protein n=1 Tax=Desulfocucumis palustris TaxID=1898651 RepID=A0A2L2XA83_9FIRM|nr:hypothetical protein DCCM_0739 [Desulfocucumis palustris]
MLILQNFKAILISIKGLKNKAGQNRCSGYSLLVSGSTLKLR